MTPKSSDIFHRGAGGYFKRTGHWCSWRRCASFWIGHFSYGHAAVWDKCEEFVWNDLKIRITAADVCQCHFCPCGSWRCHFAEYNISGGAIFASAIFVRAGPGSATLQSGTLAVPFLPVPFLAVPLCRAAHMTHKYKQINYRHTELTLNPSLIFPLGRRARQCFWFRATLTYTV